MFGTQKRLGSVRAVRAPVAASFSPAILVPPVPRDRVMPLPAVAAAATAGTDENAGRGDAAQLAAIGAEAGGQGPGEALFVASLMGIAMKTPPYAVEGTPASTSTPTMVATRW